MNEPLKAERLRAEALAPPEPGCEKLETGKTIGYMHRWRADRCQCGALPPFTDSIISNVPLAHFPAPPRAEAREARLREQAQETQEDTRVDGVPSDRPLGSTASSNEVARIEGIARELHAGQKDTVDGTEYVTHLARVVDIVKSRTLGWHLRDEALMVAWLHDAIEDVDWLTADHLRARSVSENVINAVELLTRTPPIEYASYIERIRTSGNALAICVKRADLADHLRPNCPERLRPRYVAAAQALASLQAPAAVDPVLASSVDPTTRDTSSSSDRSAASRDETEPHAQN